MTGYLAADDSLKKALTRAYIVVVIAGIARRPGMTKDGKHATTYFASHSTGLIKDIRPLQNKRQHHPTFRRNLLRRHKSRQLDPACRG